MQTRSAARALRSWAAHAAAKQERRRLLRLGLSGLVLRVERGAWTSWRSCLAEGAVQRRAVARWRRGALWHALVQWRERALAQAASTRRLLAAAAHFSSSGQACAWAMRRWWVMVEAYRVQAKAAAAWARQAERRAMSTWMEEARSCRRLLALVLRSVQQLSGERRRLAFSTWLAALGPSADVRERAARHWMRHEASRAWRQHRAQTAQSLESDALISA